MQEKAAGPLIRAGRTGDDDGRVFRIGAGGRIDQVEGAGAVAHDRNDEAAVIARRGIRGKTHGWLVAKSEIRRDVAFLDHPEQVAARNLRECQKFRGRHGL